jgi:hypothetical protein
VPVRWLADATLLASYPLVVMAGLWPSARAFGVLALVTYLAEARAARDKGALSDLLAQAHLGVTMRFAIRDGALLLLLIRLGEARTAWFVVFAGGLLVLHGVRAVHSGLALFVVRRRRLPVVTRGIDLAELRIPDAPPRLLAERHVRTLLHLDVFPLAGAVVGAVVGSAAWPALTGLAVAYGLGVAAIAVMARHAWRCRHLGDSARVMEVVNGRIRELKPEVVLYFSGSLDSAYQVNMWLSTVDRLDRRTLILLRERGMVDLLGNTTSPVVCVPAAFDVMMLDLSDVSVALFTANVGKNLHMLRFSGIKSVFLNHGDSDKPASFNPFSKAYDEVWVAGPAGRDRYREADVGVRDDEIVEVGRPQLAQVAVGRSTPDPMFTVLYAPTWEGWSDDLLHTSVPGLGRDIVRMLLEQVPNLRVLYKPHPLTGARDPAVVQAHDEIVEMIERANAGRAASGGFPDPTPEQIPAAGRLSELTRRIATVRAGGPARRVRKSADEAELSRDGAGVDPARGAALREATEAWHEAYWSAGGWWWHRVITGPDPQLYECFNRCDLLITDISSVASDFIVSGKPYAVTNVGGLGDGEFRELFPTAATGAYVINPGCAELPEILAEARKEGPDRLAAERRAHQAYLLGPDNVDAFTRFANAVDRLIDDGAQNPAPEPVPQPAVADRAGSVAVGDVE